MCMCTVYTYNHCGVKTCKLVESFSVRYLVNGHCISRFSGRSFMRHWSRCEGSIVIIWLGQSFQVDNTSLTSISSGWGGVWVRLSAVRVQRWGGVWGAPYQSRVISGGKTLHSCSGIVGLRALKWRLITLHSWPATTTTPPAMFGSLLPQQSPLLTQRGGALAGSDLDCKGRVRWGPAVTGGWWGREVSWVWGGRLVLYRRQSYPARFWCPLLFLSDSWEKPS